MKCCIASIVAFMVCAGVAQASVIPPVIGDESAPGSGIWTGSDSDGRQASAVFTSDGDQLLITLTNLTGFAAPSPSFMLQGFFFDITGLDTGDLNPVSAVLPAGQSIYYSKNDVQTFGQDTNISGHWMFRDDIDPGVLPEQQQLGLSSVGLGVFGPHDLINDNQKHTDTNGIGTHYGILPENGGDGGFINGSGPFVSNQVQFALNGWDNRSLDLINNVSFQFGTSLSQSTTTTTTTTSTPFEPQNFNGPAAPEPATAILGAGSALALMFATRRRRHA